ncbi:transcriptional regulator [Bacillus sp. MUM 116]|uniref:helix-turn-helix transcriptional regulator n=1 Tax=Bacillus sp. MUM 116 TaxID=1678002 RepID=UPI0008F5EBFB|nr:helix-turn-helix transcriptional regulator [Bacillus sp. MUM 116]OIK13554.1 transcriptional regulator [Bacillus sp. MUM 116]
MTYRIGKCLLQNLLRRKRMTQQELADRTGKTKQTISRYINNQSIMSYETAINIAAELDCTMEDLYEIVKGKK